MTTLTAGERVKDWCQSGGLIEFPGLERANLWYGSSTYQAIKPVRSSKTENVVLLVSDVAGDHKATDILG